MADVFISYARSTAAQAYAAAEALRALGYSVWLDADLAAHSTFTHAIEEQLAEAKAALVIWSADAARSEWVLSEANRAREERKLVQIAVDKIRLPMPFDQIQCQDLTGWAGDAAAPGWRKALESIAELMGHTPAPIAEPAPAAPPLPAKPSIAVLPFADLSPGKDQDYFCDGMVVEIVTALSRFKTLFVIASATSLTYRDASAARLPGIARELGVRFLLQGSVRKAGDRVRIAVELIDAGGGAQAWAQRFDDTLEDVFALQDRVANAVAGQIEPTILDLDTRRAASRPTQDMTAYDLYLQGLRIYAEFSKEAFARALALLDEAVARDPDYGPALSITAFVRTNRLVLGWSDDPDEDRRIALDHRTRALRTAGDNAEPLVTAAMASMQLGVDRAGSLAYAEDALARHPGSATVQMNSAFVFVYSGMATAALEGFEASQRLDPRSVWRPIRLFGMAFANLFLGRFEAAIPLAREAGELMPDFAPFVAALVGCALGHLGRREEARQALAGHDLSFGTAFLTGFEPRDRDVVLSGLAKAFADD